MKDYFEFRRQLTERTSVKDLPMYKDRDRKGHQAFMYINKKDFKSVDKLSGMLKGVKGKFHISSFDGLDNNPSEVELYGDLKVLQQIAKKFGGTKVNKSK